MDVKEESSTTTGGALEQKSASLSLYLYAKQRVNSCTVPQKYDPHMTAVCRKHCTKTYMQIDINGGPGLRGVQQLVDFLSRCLLFLPVRSRRGANAALSGCLLTFGADINPVLHVGNTLSLFCTVDLAHSGRPPGFTQTLLVPDQLLNDGERLRSFQIFVRFLAHRRPSTGRGHQGVNEALCLSDEITPEETGRFIDQANVCANDGKSSESNSLKDLDQECQDYEQERGRTLDVFLQTLQFSALRGQIQFQTSTAKSHSRR
ncbi:uncharacterized protein V6R79_005464 [Siganus canaliculatus]